MFALDFYMMKYAISFITLLALQVTQAQEKLSSFFSGTWKVEGKSQFERWDILNESHLKGFSYSLSEKTGMTIMEYLDLKVDEQKLKLEANVIGQNQGKTIAFEGSVGENYLLFLNPEHDFPKKILYQKISADSIRVSIGAGEKEISYKMIRQSNPNPNPSHIPENSNYDEALAQKLGADERGMKSFFFVVLTTGTNQTKDKEFINTSFQGHMTNINRLVEEDKLIVAGPFGKNEDSFRGLFIFQNVASQAELETLLKTDPAIKNNLLNFKIYNWYGSAALPMYLPFSKKIAK